MYKAIIFDFFGVIQADPYQQWLSKYGFKREGPFADATKLLDRGFITMPEFWENLSQLSGESFESIKDAFYTNQLLDVELIKLIRSLKKSYKIGLLSNSRSDYIKPILIEHRIIDCFDEIIVSSDLGVIKPDPKIFKLTLSKLEIQASDAIFIDDNETNVTAAADVGIKSICYRDLASLKEELSGLGITGL